MAYNTTRNIVQCIFVREEGSSSVSGPVGLGNLTSYSPLRFPSGFKYVKIDFDRAKIAKATRAITSEQMK